MYKRNLFERCLQPMADNLARRNLTNFLTVLHDQLSLRDRASKFLAEYLQFVHVHVVLLYKVKRRSRLGVLGNIRKVQV